MKIWIDADAAPNDVKEIVFRASSSRGVPPALPHGVIIAALLIGRWVGELV